MKTYTVELRADFVDDEKHDILLEAVREAARTMLTTAMMLKDKRDPQIALQAGDMFEKNSDLEIFNEELLEGGDKRGE